MSEGSPWHKGAVFYALHIKAFRIPTPTASAAFNGLIQAITLTGLPRTPTGRRPLR